MVSAGTQGQAWCPWGQTPRAQPYRHAGRGEGQILQGFQDFTVSAQEGDSHVDGHLCHGAFEAAVHHTRAQHGQSIGHKGRCKLSDVPLRKDLTLLDDLVESLTLLAAEHVEKYVKGDGVKPNICS